MCSSTVTSHLPVSGEELLQGTGKAARQAGYAGESVSRIFG